MTTQDLASFGSALGLAIRAARFTQAKLARDLGIDAGQVSRWTNNKAIPHVETVKRIEALLGADLTTAFDAATPDFELYVSAPITGLEATEVGPHRDAVGAIVSAAHQHVNNAYWPGEQIRSSDELDAADLATERNMKALAQCQALLYIQLSEVIRPSGALIELGIALGRRIKTTIILKRGLPMPYMLEGFGTVAANLAFLPSARVYTVQSNEDAVALVARNGRALLGLT